MTKYIFTDKLNGDRYEIEATDQDEARYQIPWCGGRARYEIQEVCE